MAEIPDVTDASFEQEVLQAELPVLVDFWGDHCPACRQISPILRQLAEERAGRLKVVKMHAAENPATSTRYAVLEKPERGRGSSRRALLASIAAVTARKRIRMEPS